MKKKQFLSANIRKLLTLRSGRALLLSSVTIILFVANNNIENIQKTYNSQMMIPQGGLS